MKKTLCIILVIVSIVSFALAETNLSEMSYDDLNALYHNLVKEIMSRPEWKEVSVPAGNWVIGKDIPAGEYGIKIINDITSVQIDDDNGHYVGNWVLNADDVIGKLIAIDGYVINLNEPVIFTPVSLLGF